MAWKVTDVMNQKTEFVLRAVRGTESMTQLCREYGISRKTGHKWKNRFLQQGLEGLAEQSRQPHSSPGQLSEDMTCRIVALKQAHPTWGPRKIRAVLARSLSPELLPSESSFKRVLEKAGLVKKRRRRSAEQTGRVQNRVVSERPNQVWTIDFKGWWRTRDRGRFEPLTIRDDYSRFVLCARSLSSTRTEAVQEQMQEVFEQFGLPEVIRSDNGPPFASATSPLGVTRLSVWWLALGIDLDRIRPGHPEENGGHERMHRDMLALQKNPASERQSQQAALDEWRKEFNQERPHEALSMQTPGEVYRKSPRKYEPTPIQLTYPTGCLVRRVYGNGRIKLRNVEIQVSTSLSGYDVGLEYLCDWRYSLWLGGLCLGEVDWATESFQPALE